MKIVHVTALYPPQTGGIARVPFEVATRQAVRGHEVHVVTLALDGLFGTRVEEGVTVHRSRPWFVSPNGKAGLSFGLLQVLRRERFDVVHLHVPFYGVQEWLAVFALLFPRVPLVLTYHMDLVARGWMAVLGQVFRRVFLPMLLYRTRAVTVAAADYAETSWIGPWARRHPERMLVVPFGVDTERFRPCTHTNERTRLLFVAGLGANHYFKGLSVLLDALAILRERSDVELSVVGDGSLRSAYEDQTKRLGLSDRVRFLGRVADGELPQTYAAADLFVLPSIDRSEAYGLVLLEAQSSGVPVIASDLDGVRTLVDPGVTGTLVAPKNVKELADAIAAMLDDPDHRKMMGEVARARVEEAYTWERHLDGLDRAYKMCT